MENPRKYQYRNVYGEQRTWIGCIECDCWTLFETWFVPMKDYDLTNYNRDNK